VATDATASSSHAHSPLMYSSLMLLIRRATMDDAALLRTMIRELAVKAIIKLNAMRARAFNAPAPKQYFTAGNEEISGTHGFRGLLKPFRNRRALCRLTVGNHCRGEQK